jgi:hypothetical protein
MEYNSPVKRFIDEPNFSGSVGTAYTRLDSSDPVHSTTITTIKGKEGWQVQVAGLGHS